MNKYIFEINKSMKFLSQKKNSIFLGQSVAFPGSSIFVSLKDISDKKKLELPVFEETQMGMTLGLAMEGFMPISCFPRFDFLICAMNQLVNHLDKIDYITDNKFTSKIFIRTMVGSNKPLDAGPQHTQNHAKSVEKMCKNIRVIFLKDYKKIYNIYKKSYHDKKNKIFLFVEDGNRYN